MIDIHPRWGTPFDAQELEEQRKLSNKPVITSVKPNLNFAASLSPMQAAVLRHLCNGLSILATAEELSISFKTVKNHLTRIYRLAGEGTTSQARLCYHLGACDVVANIIIGGEFPRGEVVGYRPRWETSNRTRYDVPRERDGTATSVSGVVRGGDR